VEEKRRVSVYRKGKKRNLQPTTYNLQPTTYNPSSYSSLVIITFPWLQVTGFLKSFQEKKGKECEGGNVQL
jgi:hypothetical protein